MRHRKWKEMIELSLWGELEPGRKQQLDGHLASCAACRVASERMKRLQKLITEPPAPAVEETLLADARRNLHAQLMKARSGRPVLADRLREFFSPRVRWTLATAGAFAAGCVATAILLSSFRPHDSAIPAVERGSVDAGEMRYANVRFIGTDPSSGEVDFAFDAVRPVRMRGRIDDDQIQRILTHALLTEENPGVRLQSVSVLSGQKMPDREVKVALIAALKGDENPGVRKEALNALRNYPMDEEIKSGLLYVLTHERNAALRIAAIDALDTRLVSSGGSDTEIMNAFKSLMQHDNNNYIRLRAKAAVQEIHQ